MEGQFNPPYALSRKYNSLYQGLTFASLPVMYTQLSDATGVMEFNLEKSGDVTMSDFQSEDVFILDTKSEVFVWIGDRTTDNERRNSIIYAHNYLKTTDHPLLPIVCLREGMKSDQLDAAIAA